MRKKLDTFDTEFELIMHDKNETSDEKCELMLKENEVRKSMVKSGKRLSDERQTQIGMKRENGLTEIFRMVMW